ncbi:putative Ig domain-containing protein [Novosphingobium aquiterrae]|uniref:Ig domain-containing protein n=1 Tax=Novosphingobium aquiterrae TaxID=624388 RepID=A0ABV6PGL4_9SPHN
MYSTFDRLHLVRAVWAFALMLAAMLALTAQPAFAAHNSVACTAKAGTVTTGGTVTINVTDCTPLGIGFAGVGPVDGPAQPQHGSANLRISGSQWVVDYSHNGDSATSDYFEFTDASGNFGPDTVGVTITITGPTSPIIVTPGSLPSMTAGTSFSQTLTSTGGAGPYSYTLQNGALPVGLTLSGSGIISGTPKQRGAYSFSVRSTDSTAPTAQFTDKGYTGNVANPSLALASGTITLVANSPASTQLATVGGVSPYIYATEPPGAPMPFGLSLSTGGLITGTPTTTGSATVQLRVTDASTGPGQYFELENLTINVISAPTASIAVSPATVSEDGASNLTYTVSLSSAVASPTTVNITTAGTATAGTDYSGNVTSVTIPAGSTSATITINPTVDGTIEPDETVTLSVAAGSGYTVGAPAAATGTIINDDVPQVTISATPAAVAEDGAPNLVYTVALNQAAFNAIVVNYTIGGTAINGTDYATIASPLTIPAGSTSGTITVNPTADATIESDETVSLTLGAGTGYTVGVPGSAVGTILNDDLPNLSINDVTVAEGNAGTTNYTFTVALSAPAGPGGVGFDIATANGSATGGVDYVSQTLTSQTIPAGSSTYTFTVQVNGDTLNEPSETFFVNVTNVTNAVVVDGQGVGTITNDDALPSLSINDVTVIEGDSGTTNAVFTVTLSAASGQSVGVNYATADGTATQPADYTSTSGTLTFAPGQTTRTITVPVIGETAPEANETYFVNISGATNATIADNQGLGTITNDDVPVTLTPGSIPGGTVGTAYSQTITPSGGTSPYSFSITAGALPAGLTLSSGGTLSGTPTAGGTFNFTVTATDSSGAPGPFSGSQNYSLTIAGATVTLPPTSLPGGTDGVSYSASITPASGGTAPYSYAITAGALPGGLALSPSSGAITGTPTATDTFNFSVSATDSSTGSGPYTATQSYSIAIAIAAPVAGNSNLTVAYNAASTNVPLSLSGGPAASLAITTAPSHGSAVVSGTTITYQASSGYAGPDSFAYTATNATGTSAPATVSVTVQNPVVTITAGSGFSGTVAAPYSNTFTFNGGASPWSGYQVTGLPAGLAITGTTASSVTISGTPSTAGSFNLNVSANDSSTGNGPFSVGQAFVLNIAAPTLSLTPAATTFTAAYGAPFTQAFTASGGIGAYSYAITGALPTGLTFTAGSGTISGTPTAPGSYTITVTATDTGSTGPGAPYTASANYTVSVPAPAIAITPTTLTAGAGGAAYNQQLTASGGIASYTYSVTAGTLPPGLTLSTAGLLSGTPTSSGTFNFTVTAADANGQTGAQAYSLTINAPGLTITPATLPAAHFGVAYSQTLTASGGIAPYHFAISVGALPTGLSLNPNTGAITGTPSVGGVFNLTVTATDSTGGTPGSGSRAYTFNVIARPDPASDPEVRGLVAAQAAIARRVAQTQIENFHQRLQQLHSADASGFSNGMRLAQTSSLCRDIQIQRSTPACSVDGRGPALNAADGSPDKAEPATTDESGRTGIWTSGTIRFGDRDATTGRPSYSFLTQGVSMGMDYRFSPSFSGGIGLGFSHERQDIGDNGSGIRGNSKSVVVYASHRIAPAIFVDWLTGYQWIDFGIRRYVTSTKDTVQSNRDGHQWFGSISAMADLDREEWRFAPYLKLDMTRGNLAAYAESSGSLFDLRFLDQRVDTTTLAVGARFEKHFQIENGRISPLVHFEYQRDLQSDSLARVGYADLATSQFSTITLNGFDRDRFMIGIGGELVLVPNWSIDAEYGYRTGSDSLGDNSIRLGVKVRF